MYTRFSLTWRKAESDVSNDTPDEAITAYIEACNMYYAVDNAPCKWYEWRKDMTAMSAEFPNVLFKLHGEGEENDDIWDAFFLNGKSQVKKARIMIDECDPKAWE